MKYKIFFLSGFIFLGVVSFAQSDSLQSATSAKGIFLKQQILPASLILSGSLLNIGTIKHDIQDQFPKTNTHIDEYIQYAPIGEVFLFDALGFKHQNTLFNQVKYMAISQAASGIIVHVLKATVKVWRPVGGNVSFPSGHTTLAFAGATALFHEFKDAEPVVAYSGFVVATATGVLRITNSKHWLPDVLAGAGIGILTTNLVYYYKPLKDFQPFKKNKNLTVVPVVNSDSFTLICCF